MIQLLSASAPCCAFGSAYEAEIETEQEENETAD